MLKKMLKPVAAWLLVTAVTGSSQAAGQSSSPELLKAMHSRYYGKVCKSYTFSQRNTHYNNDTVSGNSTWHELVSFPDRFTIFFGDTAKGNYVHFRNDSVYSFRHRELIKAGADSNVLLLLLGGMYYRQIDDVAARLKKSNYDPAKFSVQKWNGVKVFVYGAESGDTLSNQFWVNANTLAIVRIREKMNARDHMDMRFESHQKLCGGYVETRVSFRRNGRLEQVEEYYDIRPLTE
jgi:hypothetical protein